MRTASSRLRDGDCEQFPQAEDQLIETGRAHLGPTQGSGVTPIVDPRATGREENLAHGGNIRKEEPNSSCARETGHVNGLHEAAGAVSRANRCLTS